MTDALLMPDISHHNCERLPDGTYIPKTIEQFAKARAAFGTDWHLAAIMHKATQGNDFTSPVFATHVDRCDAVGFRQGAYHFVDTLDHGDGTQQAEHFFDEATAGEPIEFLCIDWERGGRFLALELAERLKALGDDEFAIGDYIGSHARSQGGQLPGMDFHMVPQYGPAMISPEFATDPLSAWQYTDGEVNGTDLPSTIPGIGPCDVSALFRPDDFGLGIDMATTQIDLTQDIYPDPNKQMLLGSLFRELDEVLPTLKALAAAETQRAQDNATRDQAQAVKLQQVLTQLAELDPADDRTDEILAAIQKVDTGAVTAAQVIDLMAIRLQNG